MILDTSYILDVEADDPDAVERARDLERSGRPQRLSSMTLYVLTFGVGYAAVPEAEQRRVAGVLGTREVYDADAVVMRNAGRLDGELTRRADAIGDVGDLSIGATALVHDEPVLTRNVDHFERIDGLRVETYRSPVGPAVTGSRFLSPARPKLC